MKRTVSEKMVILILMGMLMLVFNLQSVKAVPKEIVVPDDYLTIQEAVNSADEGDAIFVRSGTYYENVYVNKTVTLIGENRETAIINGSRVGNALCVIANNVTVSNFTITGSELGYLKDCGIYVNSSNNVFFNNIIAENSWGIYFDSVCNNTVTSNRISNNWYGHYIERSDNNTFERNLVTGNNIGFYSTHSDYNLFDGNMVVENEGNGILVLHSYFCTFHRNTLIDNAVGFWLERLCNCLFLENSVVNNREVGFRCHGYSYDNLVIGNNITRNKEGFHFHDTSRTPIFNNTISKNEKGIAIYGGSSTNVWLEIKYNNVINNTIGLWQSEYFKCALVSQNNFVNNSVQAENENENLQWNADYPSGGNYWSDYDGKDLYSGFYQNETGSDGMGDAPYVLDENNQDHYPPMAPINVFAADTWNGTAYYIDVVSNSSVSDFQLNLTQRIISFNVSGLDYTFGFCRVTIPNAIVQDLWQGNYTVLVDGKPALIMRNWTDGENTYSYFTYHHSEHDVIIIPEFPSTVILLLAMTFITLVVIIERKYFREKYHHQ